MLRFAVIGNPIAHSVSPIIHQAFAEQVNLQLTYTKIKGDEEQFEAQVLDFFAQNGRGLNITLPFKQRAFSMAQVATTRCRLAGAANTLWVKDEKLHADNTDGISFIKDVTPYLPLHQKRILILGAGGAVRGLINPLLEQNPTNLVIANRTKAKADELSELFPQVQSTDLDNLNGEFDLVINATSASLDETSVSFPKECLNSKPFCYDLAYKLDQDTVFVAFAKKMGCSAVDGLGMLVEQAAEAFYIWNGIRPETKPVLKLLRNK